VAQKSLGLEQKPLRLLELEPKPLRLLELEPEPLRLLELEPEPLRLLELELEPLRLLELEPELLLAPLPPMILRPQPWLRLISLLPLWWYEVLGREPAGDQARRNRAWCAGSQEMKGRWCGRRTFRSAI